MFGLTYLRLFPCISTCETLKELMKTTYDMFITCFQVILTAYLLYINIDLILS
jgi:Fe2+ transport system protein B